MTATRNPNQFQPAGRHYRPEIDGLRAIAVLAVVFYHYRLPGFDGGYVGVDIFFVISGYLITTLIYAEMRNGSFSLMTFYERRVRRIFPALFSLLAVVTCFAFLLLLPSDLTRFSKSLTAATVFSANILFWHEGGYFDAVGTVKPLLHTWSLAVEEQFYLIYPTLLLAIRKANRGWVLGCVGLLLAASLGASAIGVRLWPSWTFYSLPSRMWELMLGAVLALGDWPSPQGKLIGNFLGFTGLVMIGIAIVLFGDETPFPGIAALLPCIGAALVIYSGGSGKSIAAYVLGARIPVLIGLVSYSLYLWHWPLYVFGNYLTITGIGTLEKLALIFVSFLLAYISYRYVETRFRGKGAILSRNALFSSGLIAMGVAVTCGTMLSLNRGCLWRYHGPVRALAAGSFDVDRSLKGCFSLPLDQVAVGALCRIGYSHAPITFLLWGDSHAQFLAPAVSEAASRKGVAGLVVTETHCAPLIGVRQSDKGDCRRFNDAVVAFLQKKSNINEVILAARWARTALGTPYAYDEPRQIVWISDNRSTLESYNENRAVFSRGLERTVSFLAHGHRKIVAIASVPEVRWTVPETSA
ncbi:MAG: acyltransferase, partial [Acidobacteriaceae bacterium]|nr:acyltransferase [Acidobacteriaceae bacterium]